jgi:hypothetical protein
VRPSTDLEPHESSPTGIARPDESPSTSRVEAARLPTTGRTFSDLFVEFVHQPRAVATLLTFAPCAVYVPKVDKVSDLLVPLVIAAVLNLVWFVVGHFTRRNPAGHEDSL